MLYPEKILKLFTFLNILKGLERAKGQDKALCLIIDKKKERSLTVFKADSTCSIAWGLFLSNNEKKGMITALQISTVLAPFV